MQESFNNDKYSWSNYIKQFHDSLYKFSLEKIEEMTENNYNQNIIKYSDTMLSESRQLEPGQSQFITYHKLPVEIDPDP